MKLARQAESQWRRTARAVSEHLAAIAVVAGAGALFSLRWTPLIRAHPLLTTSGAAAAGCLLTLGALMVTGGLRRRQQARIYSSVATLLPDGSGAETRKVNVPVIATEGLTWDDFLKGIALLDGQITDAKWTPDLVVAVNQGDALIGFLRSNQYLRNAKFGSLVLDKDRKCRSVALPKATEFKSPIKALLVDYQLKKGSAIAVAAETVRTELGVDVSNVRVAVMVLGAVSELPKKGKPQRISSDAFKPQAEGFTDDAALKARVAHLHYLAFLCHFYPTPPWSGGRARGA